MAYKIVDNPESCWHGGPLYGKTCTECYWSQVKDGQWHGSQRCFDAGCLKLAPEEAKRMGLREISVDMWRKSEGPHNAIHYEYDGHELHECDKRGICGEYSVPVPESDRAKVEALAEAERLTWADSWEVAYCVNVDELEEVGGAYESR